MKTVIPPPPSAAVLRFGSTIGVSVFGAGLTVLTKTDCNVVNGILGLTRQGKGGLLNKNADELMDKIDKY